MTDHTDPALESAYGHCLQLARSHYENFPVASLALPRRLRRPVAVIYAFARTADDFADEGRHDATTRLALLADYRRQLQLTAAGQAGCDPVFLALRDVLERWRLPVELLDDLLKAFIQDVTQKRYASFDELMAYCRWSANPIGRLLLHLYGTTDERCLRWSDAICSALQLINFWQDLAQDYDENQRIYVPEEDLRRFGVSETQFRDKRDDRALRALMDFEIDRAQTLLLSGAALPAALPWRPALQLRLTLNGGLAVLRALRRSGSAFARPRLGLGDWLGLLASSLAGRTLTH